MGGQGVREQVWLCLELRLTEPHAPQVGGAAAEGSSTPSPGSQAQAPSHRPASSLPDSPVLLIPESVLFLAL